ncbi:MAG: SRPBCC domain-containing protein [Gemmatimonadales bacterium]
MADIFHHFPIRAPLPQVLHAVSSPEGLDAWWTKGSSGEPRQQSEYTLDFGAEHEWRAVVTHSGNTEFELELTQAQGDWLGTRVGFVLEERDGATQVRFHHVGWPEENEHYHESCYCWAMYLRLLKRYVEHGEIVAYESRLDA